MINGTGSGTARGTLLLPQAAAGRPVARARVLPQQRLEDAEANPSADTSDLPMYRSTTPDLATYVASA
jgi:hypothetical protein